MAIIIDGKARAEKCRLEIAAEVSALKAQGITPGLAVVIVGENPASQVYVRNKAQDCAQCGIYSEVIALPGETTQKELLAKIKALSSRGDIHGILIQLPLPSHIDETTVLRAIPPNKDVDAFHPENVGLIYQGKPRFLPCTPAGVMDLLDAYDIPIEGRHCVVLGRSNIVGKPQAQLLLERHATVTICHSRTADLGSFTRQADILVCAVGRRRLVTGDMVKSGAVVIDVAMNKNEAGKLCGDVVFDEVSAVCSHITPVPGGVGPMTRVMLLRNTLTAATL